VASQESHPRSLRLFLSCSVGNSPRRGSKLPGNVNGTDAKGTQKKRKEDKANAKRRRAGDRISAQINNSWMWMCYCTVDLVFTKFRTQSMTQSAAAPLGLSLRQGWKNIYSCGGKMGSHKVQCFHIILH